jgi:hypothetical protein
MNEPLLADGLQTQPLPMQSSPSLLSASSIPSVPGVGRRSFVLPRRKLPNNGILFLVVFCLTFFITAAVLMRSSAETKEPAEPAVIGEFTYWPRHTDVHGVPAIDAVSIRCDDSTELHRCNVDVRVRYDDRDSFVVRRLWSVWGPGEIKTVPVNPRSGAIQYVELSGTAQVNGQEVRIARTWEVRELPQ